MVSPAVDFLLGLGVGVCLFWWAYLHFRAENNAIRRKAAERIREAEQLLAEAHHELTLRQVEVSMLREMLHNERARQAPHVSVTAAP